MKKYRYKIILFVGMLLYFAAFYLLLDECVFVSLLGIPCPGCGMSRAVSYALRLDFVSAFRCHMMFWSLPYIFGYIFFDSRIFKKTRASGVFMLVLAAGFAVNYAITLYRFFK